MLRSGEQIDVAFAPRQSEFVGRDVRRRSFLKKTSRCATLIFSILALSSSAQAQDGAAGEAGAVYLARNLQEHLGYLNSKGPLEFTSEDNLEDKIRAAFNGPNASGVVASDELERYRVALALIRELLEQENHHRLTIRVSTSPCLVSHSGYVLAYLGRSAREDKLYLAACLLKPWSHASEATSAIRSFAEELALFLRTGTEGSSPDRFSNLRQYADAVASVELASPPLLFSQIDDWPVSVDSKTRDFIAEQLPGATAWGFLTTPNKRLLRGSRAGAGHVSRRIGSLRRQLISLSQLPRYRDLPVPPADEEVAVLINAGFPTPSLLLTTPDEELRRRLDGLVSKERIDGLQLLAHGIPQLLALQDLSDPTVSGDGSSAGYEGLVEMPAAVIVTTFPPLLVPINYTKSGTPILLGPPLRQSERTYTDPQAAVLEADLPQYHALARFDNRYYPASGNHTAHVNDLLVGNPAHLPIGLARTYSPAYQYSQVVAPQLARILIEHYEGVLAWLDNESNYADLLESGYQRIENKRDETLQRVATTYANRRMVLEIYLDHLYTRWPKSQDDTVVAKSPFDFTALILVGEKRPRHPRLKDYDGSWSTDDIERPRGVYLKPVFFAPSPGTDKMPDGWQLRTRDLWAGKRPVASREEVEADFVGWAQALLSRARFDKASGWNPGDWWFYLDDYFVIGIGGRDFVGGGGPADGASTEVGLGIGIRTNGGEADAKKAVARSFKYLQAFYVWKSWYYRYVESRDNLLSYYRRLWVWRADSEAAILEAAEAAKEAYTLDVDNAVQALKQSIDSQVASLNERMYVEYSPFGQGWYSSLPQLTIRDESGQQVRLSFNGGTTYLDLQDDAVVLPGGGARLSKQDDGYVLETIDKYYRFTPDGELSAISLEGMNETIRVDVAGVQLREDLFGISEVRVARQLTDAFGNTAVIKYSTDGFGLIEEVTDPFRGTTSFLYAYAEQPSPTLADEVPVLTAVAYGTGETVQYDYERVLLNESTQDELSTNSLTSTVYPTGAEQQYAYDPDPTWRIPRYYFDSLLRRHVTFLTVSQPQRLRRAWASDPTLQGALGPVAETCYLYPEFGSWTTGSIPATFTTSYVIDEFSARVFHYVMEENDKILRRVSTYPLEHGLGPDCLGIVDWERIVKEERFAFDDYGNLLMRAERYSEQGKFGTYVAGYSGIPGVFGLPDQQSWGVGSLQNGEVVVEEVLRIIHVDYDERYPKKVRRVFGDITTESYTYQVTGPDDPGQTGQPIAVAQVADDGTARVTRYEYDELGRPIEITDPQGDVSKIEYPDRQIVFRREIEGRPVSEKVFLNQEGKVIGAANALSHSWTLERDERNRITGIAYPNGSSVAKVYRDADGCADLIDQFGNKKTLVGTAFGALREIRLFERKDAEWVDRGTIRFSHDSRLRSVGMVRLSGQTDVASRSEYWSYDELDRPKTRSTPTVAVYRWSYPAELEPLSSGDPRHAWTTLLTKPLGEKVLRRHDPLGQLLQESVDVTYDADPAVATWTYDYFADGGIARIGQPTGDNIEFEYDGFGFLRVVRDQLGYEVKYEYDASGELIARTDKNDVTTVIVRNALGYPVTLRYEQSGTPLLEYRYAVDDVGRLLAVEGPDAGIARYSHADTPEELEALVGADPHVATLVVSMADTRRVLVRESLVPQVIALDAWDRPVAVMDGLGFVAQTEYDLFNNIIATTTRGGHRTEFVYNDFGELIRRRDPEGRIREFLYDSSGGLEGFRDESGALTTFATDQYNRVVEIRKPRGNRYRLRYDPLDQLISVTHPLGDDWLYQMSWSPQLKRVFVTPTGKKYVYLYDGRGDLSRIKYPNGAWESFSRDGNGNVAAHRNVAGGVTSFTYDWLNRIITKRLGDGPAWRYHYGGSLAPVTMTDPDGRVTRFSNDVLGRRLSKSNGLGETETWTYDPRGQVQSYTSPGGRVTSYGYGPEGLLARIVHPDDLGTIRFEYDANGRIIRRIDEEGKRTHWWYTTNGTIERIKNIHGQVDQFAYDANGNVTQWLSEFNNWQLEYAYDANDRLAARRRRPDGGIVQYSYDGDANVVGVADSVSSFKFVHGPMGEVRQTKDGNGNVFKFTYDLFGSLASIESPDGLVERARFDSFARLVEFENSLGIIGYTHTPAGYLRQISFPDAEDTVDFEYDLAARLVGQVGSSELASSWTYDAEGRVVGVQAASGDNLRFEYDALGRVVLEESERDVVRYHYSPNGKLVRLDSEVCGARSFEFDGSTDLLMAVRDNTTGKTLRLWYDSSGRVERLQWPNSVLEERTYDAAGRLQAKVIAAPDGTTLRREFSYDLRGNPSWIGTFLDDVPISSRNYVYDGNGQLIRMVDDKTGCYHLYEYDARGNVLSYFSNEAYTAYEYDVSNVLTKYLPNGVEYSVGHNGRGAMTSLVNADGSIAESFEYDDFGQLTEYRDEDGISTTFGYDGRGRLIEEGTPSATTLHYWAGIKQIGLSFASQLRRLIGALGIDDLGFVLRGSATTPEDTRVLHQASNQNVEAVTGLAGIALEVVEMGPFGEIGAGIPDSTGLLFGLHGRWHNKPTLVNFRNRWFSPRTKRFVSPDPFLGSPRNPIGLNRYAGFLNNPMSVGDPLGLWPMQRAGVHVYDDSQPTPPPEYDWVRPEFDTKKSAVEHLARSRTEINGWADLYAAVTPILDVEVVAAIPEVSEFEPPDWREWLPDALSPSDFPQLPSLAPNLTNASEPVSPAANWDPESPQHGGDYDNLYLVLANLHESGVPPRPLEPIPVQEESELAPPGTETKGRTSGPATLEEVITAYEQLKESGGLEEEVSTFTELQREYGKRVEEFTGGKVPSDLGILLSPSGGMTGRGMSKTLTSTVGRIPFVRELSIVHDAAGWVVRRVDPASPGYHYATDRRFRILSKDNPLAGLITGLIFHALGRSYVYPGPERPLRPIDYPPIPRDFWRRSTGIKGY